MLVVIVVLLLQNDADVNMKNMGRFTALHMASWNGHTKIVKLLLEYKADFTAKDQYSKTPLIYAQEKGFTEIAELLKARGWMN